MSETIGKKYADSKTAAIVGGVFLLLFFVTIGVVASIFIFYVNEEPILFIWYVLINLITLGLGIFFCWLIIHLNSKERAKPVNVVVFNEDTKTLRIATKNTYVSIPIKSIVKINVENIVPIAAGGVFIPIQTTYGSLVITYNENGKKKKIVSNQIKDIKSVHSYLIGLLAKYNCLK